MKIVLEGHLQYNFTLLWVFHHDEHEYWLSSKAKGRAREGGRGFKAVLLAVSNEISYRFSTLFKSFRTKQRKVLL